MALNLKLVRIYAVLVSALAFLGVFVYGHLFGLMNADITLDLLRILLAIYLIYAAFIDRTHHVVNAALKVVGSFYLGIGLLGLLTPTLGGLLPTGLTGFDIFFHLVGGGIAIYSGLTPHKHVAAH